MNWIKSLFKKTEAAERGCGAELLLGEVEPPWSKYPQYFSDDSRALTNDPPQITRARER